MRYCLTIFTVLFIYYCDAQSRTDWFSIGKTNLMIGYSDGSHQNLSLSKLNTFASIESFVSIKNVSLQVSGRISSEQFISGRPSYFRVSYDGYKNRLIRREELESKVRNTDTLIGYYQDSIYKIEGGLAYWRIKIQEFELQNQGAGMMDSTMSMIQENKDSLPELPNLSMDSSGGEFGLNGLDTNRIQSDSLSSMLQKMKDLQDLMSDMQLNVDSLGKLRSTYSDKISMLDMSKKLSSLGGIEKVDIGMSTIGQGAMSNSTIPIQGIKLKGKINHLFYDLSAGTTVPNRLFSNSVFDQVTNNTENVFNLNQFFTVNSSRFVSSAIIGLGNKDKNYIAVENFYNGRELKQFFSKSPFMTDMSSNLSGSLLFFKTMTLTASVGKTFAINDTLDHTKNEDLAYAGELKYRIRKTGTSLYAKYKKIGASYNGFSQGIYNSGFEKQELGLNSKIAKKLQLQLSYIQQAFSLQNEIYKGVKTRSGNVDLQWKLSRSFFLFGGYTLLEAQGFDTLAQGLNHLGKGGFTLSGAGKVKRELTGVGAVSNVNRLDSNMRIVNIQVLGKLNWKVIGLGVQVTYQDFQGLNMVYGSNLIIKPELTINKGAFNLAASLSFLKSEQFGFNTGAGLRLSFSPSENFTWDLIATRWLPTESLYIPFFNTVRYSPNYFDLRLKIALNRFK